MELVDWFLLTTFVAIGLASIVASSLLFRGRMDFPVFGATAMVLLGLGLAAVTRFVDGPRNWVWIGIALTWIGFAALSRYRKASGVVLGSSVGSERSERSD